MPPASPDDRDGARWSWRGLKRAFGVGGSVSAAAQAQSAEGLHERGLAAERARDFRQAAQYYRAAAAAAPGAAQYRYALAAMLVRTGDAEEAVAAYRGGLAMKPDDARMRNDLGMALLGLGRPEEAIAEIERALAHAPDLAEAHHNLGVAHHQLGDLERAIAEIGRAHALVPERADIHSNLLFILNYSARHSTAAILAEHKRFGEQHVQAAAAPHPDTAWPRRLRIGYVSPDFRSHVVSSFMLPVIARHDRERFDVHCYYTYPVADKLTEALRGFADAWADCAELSDAELADRIRADRIDILVDLAGHTVHHRLKAFALRPAPVQATYLGYPNTTGLAAIDYRISDAKADPPGDSDALCVERLVRLPRSFLCYRPGPDVHEPGPLPAASAGHVTFGSFNNFQKLSDPFFASAARVLAAVPGSRLLLKARPLGSSATARRVREMFAREGIDATRLELLGWEATPEDHLSVYRKVDVALDSFPYNGTTTTCEALWMGVPVVSLRGDRHASRVGASLLETVGLEDLVARDEDDYRDIAVRLAGDLPRLAGLRAGMRERMRASPLMDERTFVRELETCYLGMWREKLDALSAARQAASAAPLPVASVREMQRAGKPAQAIQACRQVLLAQPGNEEALRLLWDLCREAGEAASLVDFLGRLMAIGGPQALHQYLLGCTFEDLGRPQDAAGAYRKALDLDPNHAKAANNLGCLQEATGDLKAAAQSYDRALRADPRLANALYNRGNLAKLRGEFAAAEADLRRALALEPHHAEWHSSLSEVCLRQWRLDEAEAEQRAALALEPESARAHFGLGNALMMLGRVGEAEASLRRAVDLQPDFAEAHGNLLLCLHYHKGDDPQALFAEHLDWAKRHAEGLASAAGHAAIDRTPGRRLNVGYLSPNFHRHSVASFFEPLLAAHDRAGFRVFCYSSLDHPDEVTARLKAMSDEWRDIRGVFGDAAARLIREDRIDILVDLAGHTGGGRPLVFARKPAPVQIAWLGYPDTSGLREMDYRLTDAVADPEGEADSRHTEKLLRLPRGFLCFSPDPGSPAPGDLPARSSGRVTFGCFNNLAKVSPELVALWARLLAAVPASRLLLKAHGFAADSARRRILAQFAAGGIGAERLALHGPEDSAADHLARYREVDISLDTWPYNGTTTTCEALWMGVPVVTLAGRTHVSRVGASLLGSVGLADLVASNPEDYVATAAGLAADLPRLEGLRKGMRERLRASPLLDAAGFARGVEAAYRKAWQQWAEAGAPQPAAGAAVSGPLRLHVGGKERKEGWKILNIQSGPDVDFIGDCTDLGQFADASVDEIYASHVLEHLGYQTELPRALAGFHRVLRPGGTARISVPDFDVLCRLFLDPRAKLLDRFHVMRMAFGGQMDEHDYHRVGLAYDMLSQYLLQAGFSRVEQVGDFGLFEDASRIEFLGQRISLNVAAYK